MRVIAGRMLRAWATGVKVDRTGVEGSPAEDGENILKVAP